MVRGYAKKDWFKPFLGSKTREAEVGIGTQRMWLTRNEPQEGTFLEQVGGGGTTVVLGKKSGRYSMMLKAQEFGLPIPEQEEAYKMLDQVKALSNKKKGRVDDDEFKQIYRQVMGS
jgi:isopropylmalate/homocitrate/citramalate synthase